jgi:hypothetical protein
MHACVAFGCRELLLEFLLGFSLLISSYDSEEIQITLKSSLRVAFKPKDARFRQIGNLLECEL